MISRIWLCTLFTVLNCYVYAGDCPIMPVPKSYADLGTTSPLDSNTVIILGSKAGQVETYAAQTLQANVLKRYDLKLAIVSEADTQKSGNAIVLGTRANCGLVDQFCREKKIELDANNPGFDGYIIETLTAGQKNVVIIGGSSERAVTYGQYSFFDMLASNGPNVTYNNASVRDWASIKYRGRNCAGKIDVNSLDQYVRARINFIDMPDPMVGHKGHWDVNDNVVMKIAEAHRRGILVYGTVTCAVEPNQFDRVIANYENLISLDVDGIWLSFDDAGEGVNARTLIARVLETAKKHGLSGHDIVMTPPTGSYHYILTEWNRLTAKEFGSENLVWFFTRPPCECDLKDAQKIGINSIKPAWWHNWPRPTSGIITGAYGSSKYSKMAYFEVMPLEAGWHEPTYDEIKNAPMYSDTVVICAGGKTVEYRLPVLGWWAWDPAKHDFQDVRSGIYSYVFGKELAKTVAEFDDSYSKLKDLFVKAKYKAQSPLNWPPRLKNPSDMPKAQKLAADMNRCIEEIKAKSPAFTMLSTGRLEKMYLEPMADAAFYAQVASSLQYPEYWLEDFDMQMRKLVQKNPRAAAKKLESVRPKVLAQVADINEKLADVEGTKQYVEYWTKQVSDVNVFVKAIEASKKRKDRDTQIKKSMAQTFPKLVHGSYDRFLSEQKSPPSGKLLLEVTPAQVMRGDVEAKNPGWSIGLYKSKTHQAVAIAFDPCKPCKKGDMAEITAKITIPPHKGKLKLQVFLAHAWEDLNPIPAKYTRTSVITASRRWAFMQDSTNSMAGNNWITIDAESSDNGPLAAGDVLDVSFMVYAIKDSQNLFSVGLFGPIRLIEE